VFGQSMLFNSLSHFTTNRRLMAFALVWLTLGKCCWGAPLFESFEAIVPETRKNMDAMQVEVSSGVMNGCEPCQKLGLRVQMCEQIGLKTNTADSSFTVAKGDVLPSKGESGPVYLKPGTQNTRRVRFCHVYEDKANVYLALSGLLGITKCIRAPMANVVEKEVQVVKGNLANVAHGAMVGIKTLGQVQNRDFLKTESLVVEQAELLSPSGSGQVGRVTASEYSSFFLGFKLKEGVKLSDIVRSIHSDNCVSSSWTEYPPNTKLRITCNVGTGAFKFWDRYVTEIGRGTQMVVYDIRKEPDSHPANHVLKMSLEGKPVDKDLEALSGLRNIGVNAPEGIACKVEDLDFQEHNTAPAILDPSENPTRGSVPKIPTRGSVPKILEGKYKGMEHHVAEMEHRAISQQALTFFNAEDVVQALSTTEGAAAVGCFGPISEYGSDIIGENMQAKIHYDTPMYSRIMETASRDPNKLYEHFTDGVGCIFEKIAHSIPPARLTREMWGDLNPTNIVWARPRYAKSDVQFRAYVLDSDLSEVTPKDAQQTWSAYRSMSKFTDSARAGQCGKEAQQGAWKHFVFEDRLADFLPRHFKGCDVLMHQT